MAGQRKFQEQQVSTPDEGWWDSLLAEEERYAPPPPVRAAAVKPQEPKAEEPAAKPSADWVQVKDLYSKDQIVSLRVTGHNRGGLLVEGEGLYGFVPFSHLIDPADKTEIADRDSQL